MKEQDRLASIVSTIDNEVAVVPRGAYLKTPLGEVVQNKAFQGKLRKNKLLIFITLM